MSYRRAPRCHPWIHGSRHGPTSAQPLNLRRAPSHGAIPPQQLWRLLMKVIQSTLAAVLVATACAFHGGCSPSLSPATPDASAPVPNAPVTTQFALRDDMRRLWTDHVAWTRVFLIDSIAGLPDTPQSTQRLLQNQVDIGNAIRPFYGNAAADQLTSLLHDHITGAAAVVAAAKAGDSTALAAANAAWYANADQIAMFLAGANPNWPLADLQAMMRTHLDQTLAEATARLTGNWAGDIVAYDAIVAHILGLADTLAAGIGAQFPGKVSSQSSGTPASEDLHRAMRVLWEDHTLWTRVFLIDTLANLPDTPQATQRLLQNQVDIGNAMRPFYGNAAADQLTALLHDHILGAAALVAAAQAGDAARVATAKAAWYANADQIAAFLASANPAWPQTDLQTLMHMHLDQTLAEATARLNMDWAGDVVAYDAVVAHILHMADVLSAGVSTQFPNGPPAQ